MKSFQAYIDNSFSAELRLIIQLTQVHVNKDEVSILLKNIDWQLFLTLVGKHRLISHIYRQIHYLQDFIPQDIYEEIKQIKLDQSRKSLYYTVYLIKIHQILKDKNILHCFFKGPMLSFELYNDVGYREFRDIDLLVNIDDVEIVKQIIEDLDFTCIYPRIILSERQRKVNYNISHHYHFIHKAKKIDIELHWSITNPKSFFGKEASEIISASELVNISNTELPYISRIDNLVYLAAHGAIHQWYRLFWLKDFSVIIAQTSPDELKRAWELSKKLQLANCFIQACQLAHKFYKTEFPDFPGMDVHKKSLQTIPIKSIRINDLKQRGIVGKINHVLYRLKLKTDFRYYFDLIFRLRTHLSDWELIKLPDNFFYLYYLLRPFLLIYKNFSSKR
ncbi:MAG: hypothetical protein A2W99_07950 [Bacteroidetes bacterium GWF2_33_16]|nr:MAG: hypothetical protein A2X00_11005 [Bacteroidetes bacterium GWE2_32_14]OFY03708.1 MAG: hypothetical protein A2W99_07950 [Bacteroidetes bacterium GWF2_33_16]